MNKGTHFSGHPIIKQLLNLVPRGTIDRTADSFDSDRYYKTCKTREHLISMLYAALSGVSSLRELSTVMLACEGKLSHLGLESFPRRSTLSDANAKRTSEVFATIYGSLLKRYGRFLSDSSSIRLPVKHLKIVDSTTISLFADILKGVGRNPVNGKKKGGIKMYTMINAMEDVPCLVRFTSAATHDHTFLKDLELKKGSFVVFDKAYNDYGQYAEWTREDIYFVTRQKGERGIQKPRGVRPAGRHAGRYPEGRDGYRRKKRAGHRTQAHRLLGPQKEKGLRVHIEQFSAGTGQDMRSIQA